MALTNESIDQVVIKMDQGHWMDALVQISVQSLPVSPLVQPFMGPSLTRNSAPV